MKLRLFVVALVSVSVLVLFSACNLNPQGAKEKMAFNNFMEEMKATQMMEGKVGNVKYAGNSITFDILDTSLPKEEVEDIVGKVLTYYVNENNKANTGVTVLKATASAGTTGTLRATYQAGPAAKAEDLITFRWMSEGES